MSWVQLAAAGLGAGASIFGGEKDRGLSKKQFKEQMDESIQRRVADARKAGIHPLFALGAASGASPTTTYGGGDIAAAGEALGHGLREWDRSRSEKKLIEREQARQDQLASSQIHATNAQAGRDAAEAALLDSQRARLEQDMISRGHDGVHGAGSVYAIGKLPGGDPAQPDIFYGPAKPYNPEVPTSKSIGIQAGTAPGTKDIVMPDGRKINVYSDAVQADEINQIDIIYQRAIHKGTDGMIAVRNWLKKRGIVHSPGKKSKAKPSYYKPENVMP